MSEKAILFIHALTGLHPGSGTALGVVDLPVQRERHTHWPTIPGSTLKGVLRDACREKVRSNYHAELDEQGRVKRTPRRRANEDDAELTAVFGPGTVDAGSSYSGALSLTDARILAFPVRSLKGVFAWVTCPDVLDRLNRDIGLIGYSNTVNFTKPAKNEALCATTEGDHPLLVDGNKLVLEEFEFTRTGSADGPAAWIAERAVQDKATQERIKVHLVVLHNDPFTDFVRHATEVVARIGLDYERKTVKSGALFYQEFLPPETLFYSVVIAESSRRDGTDMDASSVLKYLRDSLPSYIQIGGDETIGKGLCALRLLNKQDLGKQEK